MIPVDPLVGVQSPGGPPRKAGKRCPMGWRIVERIVSVYLGIINLGFGVAIIVGGAVRFPPPTYAPLLEATGGQVWPYAALYLASGILLVGGHSTIPRVIGAAFGVAANSTFTALFLVAVVQFDNAGGTAWWAYLAFSTMNAALAALMWTHRASRK